MAEPTPISGRNIGEMYDMQSSGYAEFADNRFAWKYLERPAFDKYISDLYRPEIRVLDIGCGTGVVERHLTARGVRPENIIGIDPSKGQLEQARLLTPEVDFIETDANSFKLPDGSVDLVVTNTVIHHLDNEHLEQMLDRVYKVLSSNGCYFFVEVNPDHSAEGRDPKNTNKWTTVKTPWGTEIPFFNRDPYDLVDILDRHGFDMISGWPLKVDPKGVTEASEYLRYSFRPSRMSARYQKVPERSRFLRVNDVRIPNLIETPQQTAQKKLVERYFHAWETQSVDEITEIFSSGATYDEKPGIEKQLLGIDAIKAYWETNAVSQRNIIVGHRIIGFSKDGSTIWAEFKGGFDVRGKHIDIDGVIGFTTDLRARKITHLTEFFTTDKTSLELTSSA